ncbi:hypothetical protein EHJ13_19780 [Cronobacter dublinensis]|uniref:Uncharacterized protein n=1 Tax=Cronobacter dublinensis TaxID=413497 RepID=A0A9Q4T7A6_9ENTR|nr:hypothetical protein [Cronobacter dublinensis]EGT5659327.1 hypothetical protein [Cronobacter dublinensis subsp. dublinensis]EGT5668909.1 hypothetical protein [Cronobacter dublinensis subsp. dublinensis]EGT5674003.1 hypothetical protein [Cronobacter dublinensis subsp. dublinensis]EGT5677991.1 hypothetical protein [Cronobacter dublinensis subsp. dublinensis]
MRRDRVPDAPPGDRSLILFSARYFGSQTSIPCSFLGIIPDSCPGRRAIAGLTLYYNRGEQNSENSNLPFFDAPRGITMNFMNQS